ncbi:hypothetical protein [Clostridium sp.]|uniref:hypothetical protein n=1 Tax=Clostridium sp. TaxID=1506 RepID=UPI00262C67D0|nr:hypothetical protein [Clostridium sp.]
MIADHVKCNWCNAESYIPIGDNICPNCKKEGFLQWINEDNQEIEINKYKIVKKG